MTRNKLSPYSKLLNANTISAIDFEFCRFLLEINSEVDEKVLHAACITSMAYQNGNVCIALRDYANKEVFEEHSGSEGLRIPALDKWRSILSESLVVGEPGDFKPLILDDADRLYLHKLWHFEQNLKRQITSKLKGQAPHVDSGLLEDGIRRLFADTEPVNWQKVAAVAAVYNLFTVISGGPGTGKTTTVVRLLVLLLEQGITRHSIPTIALAAPTGKAAARLEMSIREAKEDLPVNEKVQEAIPIKVVTLHQLLGARRHSAKFQYNQENPLPYDCVIIDEVSMVDQALMSRLMDALLPESRLLLLGDKDQLASVEAGSVLGDICGDLHENGLSIEMAKYLEQYSVEVPKKNVTTHSNMLTDHIILLQKSYRFGSKSGIGKLAGAVNSGSEEEALNLLAGDDYSDVSLQSFEEYNYFEDAIFNRVQNQFKKVQSAKSARDKLAAYRRLKILSAHRSGPWGVSHINNRIEQRLQQKGMILSYERWYEGRPIIINSNDYTVGLSNGDLGVCIIKDGEPVICFEDDEDIISLSPSRLPAYSTAFALTVHKSQGSEFDNIWLVLPSRASKILSRELLYTAITRARENVVIMGNSDVLSQAIQRKIARNSGLQDYFWK